MSHGRTIALLALSALSALSASVAGGMPGAPRVSVPKGERVLVDGRLAPGEWSDAKRVAASDSVALYLKRDAKYLYVAIQPTGSLFGVDLYFDRDGAEKVLNLHASAKLGEREGRFGAWPEWAWWNNRGWAANVVRPQSFEQPDFLPDEAKEFQIDVARLSGRTTWVSFDLLDSSSTRALPATGPERHGRRWIEISL